MWYVNHVSGSIQLDHGIRASLGRDEFLHPEPTQYSKKNEVDRRHWVDMC